MAIKTRDEIMTSLKTILGDNTSDEAIALVEDVHDTIGEGDLARRVKELETEKTELDNSWRKKYRDAFFTGEPEQVDEPKDEPSTPKSFEDLFK